jgi:hypothetical protein
MILTLILAVVAYLFGCAYSYEVLRRKYESIDYVSLNDLAVEVTKIEGLKKSVDIAQAKEIMRIVFTKLANMTYAQRNSVFNRYKLWKI